MKKRLVLLCLLGDPSIPAVSELCSGGFNADSAELAALLSQTGYTVSIITNASPGHQTPAEPWHGRDIMLYRIPVSFETLTNQELLAEQFPQILLQVRQIWDAFETPPFLIHSLYWYSGYLALHLSQIYHVPFLHSTVSLSAEKLNAGQSPKYYAQRNWENSFLPAADLVLTISQTEQELLCSEYRLPSEKVRVVGRGVPRELLTPSHNESGTVGTDLQSSPIMPQKSSYWWNSGSFTYVGRIVADKGVAQIVFAWYQLYQVYGAVTPPLWLVGGTPEEIREIRAQFSETLPELCSLEQALRICWWGFLNPGALSTVLMKSLVLVHHSRYEAGGRVILEAMSTKTPVIATPYGFAKDIIRDWENGFLVNFGDIPLLKTRMSHFIRQPLLSNALGNTAFQDYQMLQRDWDYAQTHLELYQAYSTGNSYSTPVPAHKRTEIINYFQKGLLTTYPYTAASLPQLRRVIYKGISKPPKTLIPQPTPAGHSLLWLADGQYYVKQIYSILNKARIWYTADVPETVSGETRFLRACRSAESEQVLDILHTEHEFHLLVTKRALMVPDEDIDQRPEEAAETLAKFSRCFSSDKEERWGRSSSCSGKHGSTLAGYWSELFDTVAQNSTMTDAWSRSGLSDLTARLRDDSCKSRPHMGVSYGKTVYGHTLTKNGAYCLLPSADAFWGETGWDTGLLFSDWFLRHDDSPEAELRQVIRQIAGAWGLSCRRVLNWALLRLVTQDATASVFQTNHQRQLFPEPIMRLISLYDGPMI